MSDVSVEVFDDGLRVTQSGTPYAVTYLRNQGSRTLESHELLAIPEHLRVEALISVGWPAEVKEARPRETLDYGKIKFETYTSS